MSNKGAERTTLLMMLDAFSSTYFSPRYTPFLYDLGQDGLLTHIEPLFAFKGIETTIFTGVFPNVHNVWTQYCLANDRIYSIKNGAVRKVATKAVDFIPNDELRVMFRYALQRYVFQNPCEIPNLIPAEAMAYFQLAQQKAVTEPRALDNIRTVFDVFRQRGIQFVCIEPGIWRDRGVLAKAKRLLRGNHEYHFWYLKLNLLDYLGHRFGPTPLAFKDQLLKIDGYVEEIVTLLARKCSGLNILVLADHGMSMVYRAIDVLEGLLDLSSRMYKDYIAFFDSTMIRFWFFTTGAKQEICEYLRHFKCGHILTSSEKKLLMVPEDPKYGEMIYVLDEGHIVHPCFFHSKRLVKGMHGYAYPKSPEALPILIMNANIAEGFQVNKHVDYTDISHLILQSLSPNLYTELSVQK